MADHPTNSTEALAQWQATGQYWDPMDLGNRGLTVQTPEQAKRLIDQRYAAASRMQAASTPQPSPTQQQQDVPPPVPSAAAPTPAAPAPTPPAAPAASAGGNAPELTLPPPPGPGWAVTGPGGLNQNLGKQIPRDSMKPLAASNGRAY